MFGRGNFGRPIQRSAMSVEKSEEKEPKQILSNYNSGLQLHTENLKTQFNGNGALVEQKFALILKDQSVDTTEVGILAKFVIPSYAGEKKRWIKIRKSQLAYVNYLDDHYPCFYSLCAMEIDGILDKDGAPTKQLVTIPLQQLTTNLANDFMTLNMLYQTQDKDEYLIDVTGIPSLNFYLVEELNLAEKVALPLATHLMLEFSLYRSMKGLNFSNIPSSSQTPIIVDTGTKKV